MKNASDNNLCTIEIESLADPIIAQTSETILDVALRMNCALDHSCGGNGTCGTCRVLISAGLEKLGARNELENEIAMDRGFQSYERLACQNLVTDGLKIEIP